MKAIRKILIMAAGSPAARGAEKRAEMLAGQFASSVLAAAIVTASPRGMSTPNRAARQNDEATRAAATGNADLEGLRSAPPALMIRTGAIGADLAVLCAAKSSFFPSLWRRVSNYRFIRQAAGPVLVVGREPTDTYRSVLVAVDFSPQSMAAARAALALAPHARFTFVHVFRLQEQAAMLDVGISTRVIQSFRSKAREVASNELDRFIARLNPKMPVSSIVLYGAPGPTIAAYAKDIGADLVSAGSSTSPVWKQMLTRNVPMHLLAGDGDALFVAAGASPERRPRLAAAGRARVVNTGREVQSLP